MASLYRKRQRFPVWVRSYLRRWVTLGGIAV